jgi:hypothetical protein
MGWFLRKKTAPNAGGDIGVPPQGANFIADHTGASEVR